ncbi:SCP2 sterol-binding domain-containing protein [Rhodobacter sp. KR11]|jgi:putative sterol carrier protein|uniref:SCP2 sterol-binding domain-containing protein n=1 Tax=Rhodobacter sp. KR11 TaxID=2974588 RepID=UPI0022221DC6|nr:SCP2 sterol-binding domain-containing protein [Rhodobacter sp. KR11]MCW1919859.1 SCP2 sterol-binding domain-containing protein [Rhodobacter sp. KR11]
MSKVIETAVAALQGKSFDAVAKFVFIGEGTLMLDENGPRAGDEPADVTLTAASEVFEGLLSGNTSATVAFMTGKLKVDGSMGLAMKLGAALA